ncbi:hypothetical protein PspLS_01267 [Pyricularia sp. CBS 133598]|nr:hypothetical protein PspLS_01267 [Pyricularia sp. CBS 133598]
MPPRGGRVSKGPSLPLNLLREIGADGSNSKGRGRSNRSGGRSFDRRPDRGGDGRSGRPNGSSQAPHRTVDATKKPALKRSKRGHETDSEDSEYGSSARQGDSGLEDEDDFGDEDEHDDDDDEDVSENDESTEDKSLPKAVRDKIAEDDKEIAELERRLGIKGRKGLPKSFKEDGLGDLLEGIDDAVGIESNEKKKRKAEADEWLAQKRQKANQTTRKVEQDDEDEGSDSEDDDLDEDDFDIGDESSQDGDSGDDFEGFESDSETASAPKPQRENPYVAPTSGVTVAKYIPPSMRAKTGSDDELLLRIRRQTQGLVNRLTDANLISILGEIEKLYREHPRQHVTSTLVDLLLVQVCDPSSLPDTLLILTAGFATAAYKVIGMDFGAYLVQTTAEKFKEYYAKTVERTREQQEVTKETSNIITFLSQMYNFQMIGCNLVFDHIRFLLEELSELNAELLLRIIRMAGKPLRQDDPMALKDIVALIRPAMAKVGENNVSVRTKFMIETINDLKNNKMKAGASASAINTEHTTRMKKLLGTLSSRKLKATEPLRMGLKDIEDADKKGKWWLVGSSWAGKDKTDKKTSDKPDVEDTSDVDDLDIYDDDDLDVDLEALARRLMFNTDIRRSIFFAVMSALDFEDAYRNLLKLRLNKERQREVSHVLIQCCGSEEQYNPYYALVARKISNDDRRMKWNFQDTLWKFFRRLGESLFDEEADEVDDEDDKATELRRIVNIGKFYGNLIHEGVLGLDVLRCLNFVYLKPKTKMLVEVILVTALLEFPCKNRSGADEVIRKMFTLPGKPEFAKSLKYFMEKVMRRSELGGDKKRTKVLRRRENVAEQSSPRTRCRGGGGHMLRKLDLVIIGGGVAGYVAAIKAGQQGMKVTCIEKRGTLGGTCLNVGCIPSKSLLNNSHLYHQILHDTKNRGIEVGDVKLNLQQLMKAKDTSVGGLTKGVEFLLKKNGVEYLKGTGSFVNEHEIKVELNDGGETSRTAKNILIATGSEATPFPGLEIDEKRVVTSTGALALEKVPETMTVIGGGIIGLEMASVWSRLGAKVTVVEFLGQIGGPGMDTEIAKSAQKILKKQGIEFKLNTKVNGGDTTGDKIKLDIEAAKGGKAESIESEVVLVAIGRRPYTGGLGLENVGLETDDRGRVVIDSEYRTSHPHIRCVGDVTFGPMLAHKAEEEAVAVVEYMSKGYGHVNYAAIPSVMYTHPEVAWVGQSEQDLQKAGVQYRVGTFPFSANSRAKTNLDTEGMVKMLADPETDRILGVHIIGPNAGEMIAEGTLALEYGASSEDIARTCHAHPTLAEAFKEAAMATHAKAIHF